MFLNDDVGSIPGQDIVKVHDKQAGDEFSQVPHETPDSSEARNLVHDKLYQVDRSSLEQAYVNMKCKQNLLHQSGASSSSRDHLLPIRPRFPDLTPNLLKDRSS